MFPLSLISCINNYMLNNQFKRGELYFVITGVANTALARRLQKHFRDEGIEITVEQWSVLVHLWKEDGVSQQELSLRTFRDKPSITRLVDNMQKQNLVVRKDNPDDRRVNLVFLTEKGKALKKSTTDLANRTLLEGLQGVSQEELEITRKVLTQVYDNLNHNNNQTF